jgi:hypothetical protein
MLGVQMQDLRNALYSAFGERQVSTIYAESNSYQVIMEAGDVDRSSEAAFDKIYLRSKNGALVPLSAFATVQRTLGPTAVNHQGQLQAVTISFNLAPGVPLGDATKQIAAFTQEIGCRQHHHQLWRRRGGVPGLAGQPAAADRPALAVIYVLLGVLYESYIHPLTILAGLPSAAVGALLTLQLFNMELTMIATIGILMLIGIVKKNAIMMIDFALDAQRSQGMARPRPSARLPAALPAHHDDHAGRADGRAAHRAGPGRRRRAAPAAGPGRGGRADPVAGGDALHHAGHLPGAGPLQRQGPDTREVAEFASKALDQRTSGALAGSAICSCRRRARSSR